MTGHAGGLHEVRLYHDQRVPLRDGTRVSADVYLPQARGPFPVVYQWTPYESSRDRFIEWAVWFARRGYAAVVQDVRGRYESEGEFCAYRRDGEDAYDALDWVVEQPWCNGRIGTWGRSYGAIVQWQLAPLAHPALTCMAPHVINDDYFADNHYVGGAFQLALAVGAALIWTTTLSTVTLPTAGDTVLNDRVLRHLPLLDIDETAIGRRIDFWREWLSHPTDDEFWRSISHIRHAERVRVPVFQQGGWYDPYAGGILRAFNALRDRGATDLARGAQKVLIGPWSHEEEVSRHLGDVDFGPEAERVIRHDELRWYDHWLRDIDTGMLDEPPLGLFVMGANRWRHEHEWPLPGTEYTPFYLHSGGRANTAGGDGTLSTEPPGGEPADRFAYDPADPVPTTGGVNSLGTMMQHSAVRIGPGPYDQTDIERRADVLSYTSAELEADLEVTGPVDAVLYAASSAPDTDFVVRLSDVHPDGRAILVTEGIIRARYRHGLDRTELLTPGEPAELRIRCYPTSMVFRRGHRLRLDVTSSSFPRFSRNLNTGEDVATGTAMRVAQQTVLHAGEHASRIVLPVIPS